MLSLSYVFDSFCMKADRTKFLTKIWKTKKAVARCWRNYTFFHGKLCCFVADETQEKIRNIWQSGVKTFLNKGAEVA